MIGLILKGLSILGIPEGLAKIILIGLVFLTIAGTIFAGYKYLTGLTDRVVAAETRANGAEKVANNTKEALTQVKEASDRTIKSITTLANDMTKVREELDEQTEIFEKHDFDYLFQQEPDLMLNRFNNGTIRVFKELETLSGSPDSSN